MAVQPCAIWDAAGSGAGPLIRLPGPLAFESDGLGEDAVLAGRAEAGDEVGIERGGLVTEYRSRPCPETPARRSRSAIIAAGYGSRYRS